MSDDTSVERPEAAAPRMTRGRKVTIATLVTAGLATGGVLAAQGSFASGGSSAPSGNTASAPANAPRPPAAPSANDLDGTVTAASSGSLTVRSEFGTSRTFAITDDTTVHSGRTKSSAGAIEVGAHVEVRATKSGSTYTAKDVDIRPAHIGGTVKSISGDTVTVTDRDGFTRTIALSSATKYTKDGKSADRDDLTGTSVVEAEGKVAGDGTTLDATTIDIRTKAATPRGPGGHGGPGQMGAGGPGGAGRGPAGPPPANGTGTPPKPGTSGAPKAPSGAPKAPSGAPKAPSSTAPSGGASSGS